MNTQPLPESVKQAIREALLTHTKIVPGFTDASLSIIGYSKLESALLASIAPLWPVAGSGVGEPTEAADIVRAFIAAAPLWLPTDTDAEHDHELVALHTLHNRAVALAHRLATPAQPSAQEGTLETARICTELLLLKSAPSYCVEKLGAHAIQLERQRDEARAEVERLKAWQDYAKGHGLHIALNKTSDCPEGRLAHTYCEGSTLARMFDEWSDAIGWKETVSRLESDLAAVREELARQTECGDALQKLVKTHSCASAGRKQALAALRHDRAREREMAEKTIANLHSSLTQKESALATEERMRRTMESAHGEMLSECVKLRQQRTAAQQALEAWKSFDILLEADTETFLCLIANDIENAGGPLAAKRIRAIVGFIKDVRSLPPTEPGAQKEEPT